MTDCPSTPTELIAWFTATEIVRHDGSRSAREPQMTAENAARLAAKIGKPGYHFWDDEPASPYAIWNMALGHCLFMHDKFGWVDRGGNFYGCSHAAHEIMLFFLDMNIQEAEDAGWVRISMGHVQCRFQISEDQAAFLSARNLFFDSASLPRWRKKRGDSNY